MLILLVLLLFAYCALQPRPLPLHAPPPPPHAHLATKATLLFAAILKRSHGSVQALLATPDMHPHTATTISTGSRHLAVHEALQLFDPADPYVRAMHALLPAWNEPAPPVRGAALFQAIDWAIIHNDRDTLGIFIDGLCSMPGSLGINTPYGPHATTLLIQACLHNKPGTASFLLERGASCLCAVPRSRLIHARTLLPALQDTHGWSPLNLCIARGHVGIIRAMAASLQGLDSIPQLALNPMWQASRIEDAPLRRSICQALSLDPSSQLAQAIRKAHSVSADSLFTRFHADQFGWGLMGGLWREWLRDGTMLGACTSHITSTLPILPILRLLHGFEATFAKRTETRRLWVRSHIDGHRNVLTALHRACSDDAAAETAAFAELWALLIGMEPELFKIGLVLHYTDAHPVGLAHSRRALWSAGWPLYCSSCGRLEATRQVVDALTDIPRALLIDVPRDLSSACQ